MRKKLFAALAVAALAVLPAGAAFASSHDSAQVTIVHGVPGADGVNILANGDVLLEGVDFTDVATTSVPAGTYSIAVSTSDDEADAVIGPVDLTFEAGGVYAVVAHLAEGGDPTASFFTVNDAEGISAFHTADFPAVAIVAGGDIAADDLTNGNAAQIDAPAGTELPGVGVAPAGTTDIALEAGDVTIPEGQRVLAFAVGSGDDGSIQLVVEIVDVSTDEAAPSAEHSPGEAGLAATGLPAFVLALMAAGALLLAAPMLATARRRG